MKVIIFTEAGSMYGYGHLMRCIALAQGFVEHSIEVHFVLRGDGDFSKILRDFQYKQIEWLETANLQHYLNLSDIAIVDSYHVDENLCNFIYQRFQKVLFFDDVQRINYPGGFVLNGVIGAENFNYPVNPDISYFLGVDFQPLRREFWDVPEYIVKESIKHIMITFGGSDITNETPVYIQQVRNIYPEAKISVIIGKGFQNKEEIKKLKDKSINLVYSPDASVMRNIMLDCDLAISAAGQTISELARVGVPTIGILVIENQKNNIKYWKESGFLLSENVLKQGVTRAQRKKCSDIGRSLIDGQGVQRIVETVLC